MGQFIVLEAIARCDSPSTYQKDEVLIARWQVSDPSPKFNFRSYLSEPPQALNHNAVANEPEVNPTLSCEPGRILWSCPKLRPEDKVFVSLLQSSVCYPPFHGKGHKLWQGNFLCLKAIHSEANICQLLEGAGDLGVPEWGLFGAPELSTLARNLRN